MWLNCMLSNIAEVYRIGMSAVGFTDGAVSVQMLDGELMAAGVRLHPGVRGITLAAATIAACSSAHKQPRHAQTW